MPLSRIPTYNLKVVLRETGIAADTLRAWERRYGVPKPERTPGGHRLYSQHDIQLIRWLMARQAEGLSISRAVELWSQLTLAGTDPLAATSSVSTSAAQAHPASVDHLSSLQEQWLAACLNYDELTSEQTLNQAFSLYATETVITGLIQRSLYEIGEGWYRNEASVQQEHFASALAMRRLDSLISGTPLPSRNETILLACPPNEWHAFPLLALTLLLRRRGWNTVYLGADVPLARLEETARAVQPDLVVMAAQRLVTVVSLRDASLLLQRYGVPVAYGGRAFNQIPELGEHISGEYLGEGLEGAPDRVEQLVRDRVGIRSDRPSRGERGEPGGSSVARAYLAQRSQIASSVAQQLFRAPIAAQDLDIANLHLGNTLAAALDLGNLVYLEVELDWIQDLLAGHRIDRESLGRYLATYARVTRETLGSDGDEIADWLDSYASKLWLG